MTTTLVVLRHAKPVSGEGYADSDLRPLSDEGRNKQRKMAEFLKSEDIIADKIFTSPLLRAVQTAEIVAEVFSMEFEKELVLGNRFNVGRLMAKIELDKTTFFVGHIPTLENFVRDLVGEDVLPDGLSKSAAVILEFPNVIEMGKARFVAYHK